MNVFRSKIGSEVDFDTAEEVATPLPVDNQPEEAATKAIL
jgi:hypothetical protein